MIRKEFYDADDLVLTKDKVGKDPLYTGENWKKNELETFDELIHSGEDGYLKAMEGGVIPWNEDTRYNIDPGQHYADWWGRNFKFPELDIISVKNALVYLGNRFIIDGNIHFISEVRDSENRLIPEGMSRMEYGYCVRKDTADQMRRQAVVMKGTYLYLGLIILHYGHFIIESLNKSWPVLRFKIDFDKVIPMLDPGGPDITAGVLRRNKPYMVQCFQRLGIPLKKTMFIHHPIVVERLLLPTPSFRIGDPGEYIHPMQKQVWAMLNRGNAKCMNRKIYLSRRLFKVKEGPRRPLENEKDVEKLFAQNGFEVVYPEKTRFKKQLKLYAATTSMGGLAGSNILNCAFMPDGGQVISIRPLSEDMTPKFVHSISMINNLRMNYYFANSPDIRYDSPESWRVDLEDLRSFLQSLKSNK